MKNSSLFKYKDTIGYLLFKKIFFWYILFVLIITSYQVYKEYVITKDLLDKELVKTEKAYNKIIANSVWHFDQSKLNSESNAIIMGLTITGISIITPNEEILLLQGTVLNTYKNIDSYVFDTNNKIDVIYKKELIKHQFELIDEVNSPGEVLANITFYIESNELINIAKEGVYLILINVLTSALILWVLFIYFANKLLNKPLEIIINATKEFDEKDFHELEINLNTEKKHELNTLADTFNIMSKRINESFINMKQLTIIQDKQKKDLETANKYKNDFLANMSHELKTPLNSINVISSVMMKNKDLSLNEKQVKNLNIINNCGNDLLFLINDILDISKLEAGEVELDMTQVDLPRLMNEIKDMIEPQAIEKEISFVFKCDDEIGDIYSDPNRIKQIVKNLLSNALKFVKKGKVSFIIENKEDTFTIFVKDDGIGIEKNKLDHIFDRFKQADGSTTRKFGGTGLGLAISKELLGLLHGDIHVTSTVNVGTTFVVSLPKNKEKVTNKTSKTNGIVENKTLEQNNSFDKNILILNSDPLTFMSIIVELNKSHKVDQASNTVDFIKKFKQKKYDLIIIDVHNQKENEIERIVSNISTRSIVVYKDELNNNINEKADMVQQKPLNKEEFIASIN
ncbi:sensor histidine kinase [Poseidonibacter lekithochrous]|uniref:sensor histidine kinase n=1 Tax=Poseidonibacter lekithochrous TaxID=1904463 RepID=UPI0008FC3FB9|nr:HAMP domain-containing sensor histidine kinase [Poseidonibacter lekithochrous]QKJ22979.1 two-component system sensor histidine kinase [Poseidonibacter lekithochrous]